MANALFQGGSGGFQGSVKKESQGKPDVQKKAFFQNSAKADTTSSPKLFYAKKKFGFKNFSSQTPKSNKQEQSHKRDSSGKTDAEKTTLRAAGKCFICEQPGHIAPNCPQRTSKDAEDKDAHKGKKTMPSAGLVPDVVGGHLIVMLQSMG